jgi:hypothetical protein
MHIIHKLNAENIKANEICKIAKNECCFRNRSSGLRYGPEAKGSPKYEKNLAEINGKFIDVSNADENK